MDPLRLRALLQSVREGQRGVEDALDDLRDLPFRDLEFARVDGHRALRLGLPEVVFGEGKDSDRIIAIVEALQEGGETVLVTRINADKAEKVRAAHPNLCWHPEARILASPFPPPWAGMGSIAVVAAGTSDRPVAEEAAVTAQVFGHLVDRINDVGVAGIHRLFAVLPRLREARVIIAVAGMEGALPGVLAGLLPRPILAVPTSVGYGASFGGVSALLTMLNACAPGVSVVNIDNGFGAAWQAALILRGGMS